MILSQYHKENDTVKLFFEALHVLGIATAISVQASPFSVEAW